MTAETAEVLEDPTIAEEESKPRKLLKPRNRGPKHFPRPPKFDCKPEQFFKYWRGLPKECLDRSAVYVYANYPVLDHTKLLTTEQKELIRLKKLAKPRTNIAKPDAPFESDDWEMEILHRWGSGNYHFKLNDVGTEGIPAKPICMCSVTRLDNPDYPPVRDIRLIAMDHPDNQSYIAKLRLQGVQFPGDDIQESIQQEEDDMANVAAVEKLADTVVQMARDNTRNNQQPQQPSAQSQADSKAVEAVAAGAQQGFKILGEAMEKANALSAKAADPLETIRALKEVASIIAPTAAPPKDDSALLAIMKMQHDAHMAEIKSMREEIAAERARNQALLDKLISKPESTERPRSFIQELKTLSEGRDVIKDLFGMGGEEEALPWYGSALMKALEIIPGAVTNFMHNVAVARAGQGVPQPPPDSEVTEEEPAKIEAPKPTGQDAIIINTLGQLKDAIIHALATEAPGYDFAAALIHETKSEQLYGFLSSQGKAGLFNILQKHPQLWTETRPYAQRLEKFADEFLDKARVQEALSVANARPNGAPPTPAGRVVIGPDGQPIQHQGPKINKPS